MIVKGLVLGEGLLNVRLEIEALVLQSDPGQQQKCQATKAVGGG